MGAVVLLAGFVGGFASSAPAAQRAGARVRLSPDLGPPTTHTRVRGTGFQPGETVDISFDALLVQRATASSNGTVSLTIAVPRGARPGDHPVAATGESSGRSGSAEFLVRTDWPEYGFDPQNSGTNPYENVVGRSNISRLRKVWSVELPEVVICSPAVVDGIAYVGTGSGDFYALDTSDGTIVWTVALGDAPSNPVVADGRVFVSNSGGGTQYAFDAISGKKVWARPLGGSIYGSPTLVDETLYVGAGDGSVYALDAATGRTVWKTKIGLHISSSPAVASGVLYVGDEGGGLFALDAATGAALWSGATGPIEFSSPTIAHGRVYIGSDDQKFYAFDAEGCGRSTCEPVWVDTSRAPILSSPAVAGGRVYIGFNDGRLYAFDAVTGTRLWSAPLGVSSVLSSPIVANGIVYMGATDIFAFDAVTGDRLWAYPLNSDVNTSPAIADGVLFVGDFDHRFWAFALRDRAAR